MNAQLKYDLDYNQSIMLTKNDSFSKRGKAGRVDKTHIRSFKSVAEAIYSAINSNCLTFLNDDVH